MSTYMTSVLKGIISISQMYRRLSQIVMKNQVQVYSFNGAHQRRHRELDFTECVHLNLLHCLSFVKAQNISCVHARGVGSLNANYYMSLVRGEAVRAFSHLM